jgi:hypothetical protein
MADATFSLLQRTSCVTIDPLNNRVLWAVQWAENQGLKLDSDGLKCERGQLSNNAECPHHRNAGCH